MELVDVLDNKRQRTGIVKDKYSLTDGEYRQSVHLWILNDKGEFLIQKRAANKKVYPNQWAPTGGAVKSEESSIKAVQRECKEEIGIDISPDNLELVLSVRKEKVFVDVWLLRQNIKINSLTLEKEEVSEAKWASRDEIKQLEEQGKFAGNTKIYQKILWDCIDQFKNK